MCKSRWLRATSHSLVWQRSWQPSRRTSAVYWRSPCDRNGQPCVRHWCHMMTGSTEDWQPASAPTPPWIPAVAASATDGASSSSSTASLYIANNQHATYSLNSELWRIRAGASTKETRSSADADNLRDAFSGQSRSTNMVPFWVPCDFSLSMWLAPRVTRV